MTANQASFILFQGLIQYQYNLIKSLNNLSDAS